MQGLFSLAIVVGIFAFAIPKIADYSAVLDTLADLTLVELGRSLSATLLNLVTYWLQNMSALPGLGFWQAAVVTQTTTSVANTLPAGGAVAVGLTYSMLRSWGFDGKDVALYVGRDRHLERLHEARPPDPRARGAGDRGPGDRRPGRRLARSASAPSTVAVAALRARAVEDVVRAPHRRSARRDRVVGPAAAQEARR